jgi:hypothetical protein
MGTAAAWLDEDMPIAALSRFATSYAVIAQKAYHNIELTTVLKG